MISAARDVNQKDQNGNKKDTNYILTTENKHQGKDDFLAKPRNREEKQQRG